MKKSILILIFLLSITFVDAQNEGNIWYFGINAGLDFNNGAPVALTDGQLETLEGCATISDINGDLLFYTDGMLVYNRNHILMSNGSGLLGHNSSTHSAIIVKKPASSTSYYIFTVDGMSGDDGGVSYSEVDMTLDGGLGDITPTIKNINFLPNGNEKITVIKHQNNIDFWIIVPVLGIYNSFLLSNTGLSAIPVISSMSARPNGRGYCKSSPNGLYIAAAYTSRPAIVDLFDYDKKSGQLSNERSFNGFPFSYGYSYGLEFSPDSNLLYVYSAGSSSTGTIDQFNLAAGMSTQTDIINSKITLVTNLPFWPGAMQLAPDNKIYFTQSGGTHLSTIENPDIYGLGCNLSQNSVSLGVGICQLGLPTFYNSIFSPDTAVILIPPDTAVVLISEEDCEIVLEIPTVFTPNNDGSNDLFIPIISKGIVSMKTIIYNRWGNTIFETNNLLIHWNGQGVSDGTYFWVVNYIDINRDENIIKGHVTVFSDN
jgi:gliding motility-associated-like protein